MARGPSHHKDLEDMLKTFRCQDLANLLNYVNHPKNGKKTELYDRCLKLLEKGSVPVQLKIKEIYSSKNNLLQLNGPNNLSSASLLNSTTNSTYSQQQQGTMGLSSNNHDMFPNNATTSARQSSNYYNNINGTGHHQSIIGGMQTNSIFHSLQNEIKLKNLAFYENLNEVIKPLILHPINPSSRPFQFTFQFSLQVKQADEISVSRHVVDGKYEYTTQIQLRFALIENIAELSDNFPPNTNVNINCKPAPLPPPKPTSKPNADMIRPGRSVDITNLCRLAPNVANKVDITWTNTDNSKMYCACVFIVKKLTTQTLMGHLVKNCKKAIEFSKQLVIEKLAITDNDLEIETSTLKASLLCPLMKCRIQTPGRSIMCKHVQCFDLNSYLSMNEKKPTWNCPVCDRHAPYEELIIDSYFEDILQKCPDCDEIQFLPSGDWERIDLKKKDKKTNPVNTNTSLKPNDTVKPTQKAAITQNSTSTNQPPPKIVCVDLTIDSDDENDTCKKINSNFNSNKNEAHLRSNFDDNPISPSNSVIAVSSSSSSPSQFKCNSRSSSRSSSPHNLVINTDEQNANDRDQTDNIISSPSNNRGLLQISNPNALSPASLIPTTPTYSPQSPSNQSLPNSPLAASIIPAMRTSSIVMPTQAHNNYNQNSPDFTTNLYFTSNKSPPTMDIKRSNSTMGTSSYNNQLSIKMRKNSTSSNGSSTPTNTFISSHTFSNNFYDDDTPKSPSMREHGLIKSTNMKAKNVTKPNSAFNKEKAQKYMEDLKANSNLNCHLRESVSSKTVSSPRDPQYKHSNTRFSDNNLSPFQNPVNNNSNNIIRNNNSSSQFNNQHIGFSNANSKNYQITSNNNLKIRLSSNNNSVNNNYPMNSDDLVSDHHHQLSVQHYNSSNPINNFIAKQQQQQQQLINSQVYGNGNQNRSSFSNNNNNNNNVNNLPRSSNSANYNAKNSNSYQTSTRSNYPDYRFTNQLYSPHQQQSQHNLNPLSFINNAHTSHIPSQHATHASIFQNGSSNSSRLHSLAHSPPSHS